MWQKAISKPKVHYDPRSDAFYLLVKEGYEEKFVEMSEGINVELGSNGELLGIEILNASQLFNLIGTKRPPKRTIEAKPAEGS